MLELRGATDGLLDEPLRLDVKGAPPGSKLVWRARLRDDDGRVWRAEAKAAEDLFGAWVPAKPPIGPVAALRSLRPLAIDVRAELPDGEAATRTVTRRLMGDAVRLRRWRDGVTATLHLPSGAPVATVVLDATGGEDAAATVVLTAPLLASRGVLVLAVTKGLEAAREQLAAVPSVADADGPAEVLAADLLPPGVPTSARDADPAARAAAWDALLARLGARPRTP
jgi:hypothetical protein